jgi:propionyl-CoA carboxylase beta chain
VIKTVTGEDVTMEELGGAHTHMAKSGTAHYVASGEQDAFDYVRELLSYLPSNNYADPRATPCRNRPVASRTT